MVAVAHAQVTDGLFCDTPPLVVSNGQVWGGLFCIDGSTPVVELPSEGGGRGTGGIHRPRAGYERGRDDAVRETRRKRILAEDDDIVALIASMLTNRLL